MIHQLRGKRWSLQFILTVTMTTLVTAGVVVITVLSLQREQSSFRTELEAQADVLLETLENVTASPLYQLDVDFLETTMEAIGDSDADVAARLYSDNGRLLADTELMDELVFTLEPDPLGLELIAQEDTIFTWHDDKLVAGKPVILGNQLVGAISIELSTASLDAKTTAANQQGLLVAIIAASVGILLSWLISHIIAVPLQEMTQAAKRISEGEYGTKIQSETTKELAILATAFNTMADQLQETFKNLEIARDEAVEALKFRNQILANISHDARTPLSVISLYSEMLQNNIFGDLTEGQQEALKTLDLNAKRLQFFINNLLDEAALNAGQLKLKEAEFDPTQMLEDMQLSMQAVATNKGIELKTECDPSVPRSLQGDEDRINQILYNLVNNAIKFTDEGEVYVQMSMDEYDRWVIKVTDTGIGIAAEEQQRLFEAFWQADGSATRQNNAGVGLGLSIVRQLTEMMDGTVKMESRVGEGTTFIVALPLKQIGELEGERVNG